MVLEHRQYCDFYISVQCLAFKIGMKKNSSITMQCDVLLYVFNRDHCVHNRRNFTFTYKGECFFPLLRW